MKTVKEIISEIEKLKIKRSSFESLNMDDKQNFNNYWMVNYDILQLEIELKFYDQTIKNFEDSKQLIIDLN